ncbi:DctA-YdbH domain-containing protein [Ectopseudomonas oleovorans]|uniref:Uncharacterized protein n=1 Tax=Ectopseudomonas oleovorans TaxID=301 RepID=A0A653B020_ECTOL|nr:DctA-YdbH domain-containing protein [Pseudomonas oleovorans]
MSRRRFWASTCAAILALLSLLACYAGYRVQQLLAEQHIELDWQRLSLSWRGVRFSDASLTRRQDSELQLQADQVQLDWLASEAPRYRLLVQGLRADWQAPQAQQDSPDTDDPARTLRDLLAALPWLPRQISVREMAAQLPCASGRCTLDGHLTLQRLDDALLVQLQLLRAGHSATLQAQLQGLGSAPDSSRQLQMSMRLDDQPQLDLRSDLRPQADAAMRWSGDLEVAPLPDLAWVSTWLSEWLPAASPQLPSTPQQAGVSAQWQLQLPDEARQLDALLTAPGWLRIDARLPQPWPLPGVGPISGALALDLRNTGGRWQAYQAHGELQLDSRDAAWLQNVPAGLRPEQLQLGIAPMDSATDDELALRLTLAAQGPLELQADATLGLRQAAEDWALDVGQLQLDARSKRLTLAGSRLDDLHLNLNLSGHATAQQWQFSLGRSTGLAIQRLRVDELDLQHVQATLDGIDLSGTPGSTRLSGPLALRTRRLQYPPLQAQGWQWQGRLDASEASQALDGALLADSGLSMALNLRNQADGLSLAARLDELFLRAGNPLAQTLANWPGLLTLDNGRIQGDATLRLAKGKPLALLANVNGRNLAGIYDRSTFGGVDAQAQLRVNGDRLTLELANLSAEQIDPGIPLGPLHLQASYQASLRQPLAGTLEHRRAELGILGGSLSLAPASWALDKPSQLLPLRLEGLDLQALFRVYPAEGLEGNGLIDGSLPLRIGQGISVEQGRIEARAPGGQLRFHSPRIRAMGQANPGMKLVTDALEDFHYDLLDGSVDYTTSGTLQLGLRLHGQNPAIEQGRPINFNINLQEDVPSLLASLQLTDKVNDIIQQRIQRWMRQRVPQEPKE